MCKRTLVSSYDLRPRETLDLAWSAPAVSERKHTPGAIPPHHRKLAYTVAGTFFAILLIVGLALKLFGDVPVPWFWIVVTPVFITGLIVLFLWVRLSD
jgi:hypothetical protein